MSSLRHRRENEDLLAKERRLDFLHGAESSYERRQICISRLLQIADGNPAAPGLVQALRREATVVQNKLDELSATCLAKESAMDALAEDIDSRFSEDTFEEQVENSIQDRLEWGGLRARRPVSDVDSRWYRIQHSLDEFQPPTFQSLASRFRRNLNGNCRADPQAELVSSLVVTLLAWYLVYELLGYSGGR